MITVQARIKNKIDTEANWNKNASFIPFKGQIIVYDIDSTHSIQRMKIGDGKAYLIDLPFLDAAMQQHIADKTIHINQSERTVWNQKITATYDSDTETLNLI